MTAWLTSLPSWLLFIIVFAAGIGTCELGRWIQARQEKKGMPGKTGSMGSFVGAMLGLLAFMLGITFSITSSRFGERKKLVIEQARVLSACYLRTSFIPEKQKLATRRLLAEYINLLVDVSQSKNAQGTVQRLEVLNKLIWNETASLAQENMDSEIKTMFIRSANEALDVFEERKTVALVYRIPSTIWFALFALFILSMFVVGTEIGENKARRLINLPAMAAAFALVVVLIAEMDATSKSSRFKISQQPLIDVEQMIKEDLKTAVSY
jgi:hypothetical protein